MTLSPRLTSLGSSPRPTTVPATSTPGMWGNSTGKTSFKYPARMLTSMGLNALAATSTSAWPAEGAGRSISS